MIFCNGKKKVRIYASSALSRVENRIIERLQAQPPYVWQIGATDLVFEGKSYPMMFMKRPRSTHFGFMLGYLGCMMVLQ